MVLDALGELLEEKFIEGIRCKHRSLYEIEQTTEMVKMYQHRVNVEAKALTRFSEHFIRDFATDNNKCYSSAERIFKKINSTIASLKNLFYKTTPRDNRQLPVGVEAPSVWERSPLGHGDYSPDAFGMESFPEPVQELYQAFDTLFSTSSVVLALCHKMIEDEAETRQDIVRLRQIYKDSCNELLGAVKAATEFMVNVDELPDNELEERRKKAGSEDNAKFLSEGYHSVDKAVFTQYLIIKTIKEARSNGLTAHEAYFWRKDAQKALDVRKVVENFDLVQDVEGEKGRLSSLVMLEFLKWCRVPENLEKRLYEQYFRPKYMVKGKLKCLGWNTISGKRKEQRDGNVELLVTDFERRLSAIFPEQGKSLETSSSVCVGIG